MSRYPFAAAPTSWYHLAWSDEVTSDSPLTVQAFGERIMVARARDGRAVSDSKRALCERNGIVWIRHGEPGFIVPPLKEHDDPSFTQIGRVDRTFKSHVQEIVENAVDVAHYASQHGFVGRATLGRFEAHGPTFRATVHSEKLVFGVTLPVRLEFDYWGLGFGVGRAFGPVTLANLVTCLPLDDEHIRMRFTIYAKLARVPLLRPLVAKALRWHVWSDVKGEISLFENKRYVMQPPLAAGDGPIMKVRAWCRQFHTEARP